MATGVRDVEQWGNKTVQENDHGWSIILNGISPDTRYWPSSRTMWERFVFRMRRGLQEEVRRRATSSDFSRPGL